MSRQSERLFAALNDVNEEAVDEAARMLEKKPRHWVRWAGLAAVLAAAVLIAWPLARDWFVIGGSAGGAGSSGASTFMSYAGPVFPLTLREANSNISAERDITLDFAPWEPVWVSHEDGDGWYRYSDNILVADAYTLVNTSSQDQTVSVLYPFAATLRSLGDVQPVLTLDGRELETVLHAGNYTGGYMGVWGSTLFTEEAPGSVNLDRPDSWEDYRDALASGEYLERASAGYPDLSGVPVIVYEFTDPWGPERSEDIPNPSLRASFRLDYDRTTVLSTGFHAMRWDREAGEMIQGFSIPQPGEWKPREPYSLIVLGDDIQDLTLQGYVTGGTDDDPKVEAGATVTRIESDLEAVLRKYAEVTCGDAEWESGIAFEMYFGLLKDQLFYYGLLAEGPMERYITGSLADLDFATVERVFYLEAEITIPARQTVTLAAEMVKESSYDFYCAHSENQGVYRYDLVTQLGSNLNCSRQRAMLVDRGLIEIVRNNFGFDLYNNIRSVVLNPEVEHYYLEVRRVKQP